MARQGFGIALVGDDSGQVIRVSPGQGKRTSHGKRVDALVQSQPTSKYIPI